MSYTKKTWVNDQTELSAQNFNYIENGIYENQNIEIIAITDTAPEEFEAGDKYYNTTDNKIYTADEVEWKNGETPIRGAFYILIEEQSTYYYDGTTLVSVGGGTEDIIIQEEEPEEGLIWINNGDIQEINSEVVNSLEGNETRLAPSVASVRKALDYSNDEVKTGKYWVDGKPVYKKTIVFYYSDETSRIVNVAHGITNIGTLVNSYGTQSVDGGYQYPLPYHSNTAGYIIEYGVSSTSLYVKYGERIPINHYGWVTLEYTKTTD